MPTDDIIELMLVCSLVVLPALGITARFAIKPIVDAILRLKEGGVLPGDSAAAIDAEVRQTRAEVIALREEMAHVRLELARMKEAENFHAALREAPASAALPPSETPAPPAPNI